MSALGLEIPFTSKLETRAGCARANSFAFGVYCRIRSQNAAPPLLKAYGHLPLDFFHERYDLTEWSSEQVLSLRLVGPLLSFALSQVQVNRRVSCQRPISFFLTFIFIVFHHDAGHYSASSAGRSSFRPFFFSTFFSSAFVPSTFVFAKAAVFTINLYGRACSD